MKGIKNAAGVVRSCVLAAAFYSVTTGFGAASSANETTLASANNGFAFKLLKQLAKDQRGANIFISSYSASTVLQMLCTGAGGQTRVEMQQVLGTAGVNPVALHEANRVIDAKLRSGDTNVS